MRSILIMDNIDFFYNLVSCNNNNNNNNNNCEENISKISYNLYAML